MFSPHTQKKSPWKLIRFLAKPSVLEKLLQKTEIFVIAWNSHMVAHPVISFWCRPLPGFSLRQRRIIFLLGSCPIHLWALAQIGQWFFGPVSPCVMLMKWMKWRWVKGRPKTHPERCLEGSNFINMYQRVSTSFKMYQHVQYQHPYNIHYHDILIFTVVLPLAFDPSQAIPRPP